MEKRDAGTNNKATSFRQLMPSVNQAQPEYISSAKMDGSYPVRLATEKSGFKIPSGIQVLSL